MQQLLDRPRITKKIRTGLRESPVTVLLGARQVGKTTFAEMVAERYKRVTVFDLESAPARCALAAHRSTSSEELRKPWPGAG